MRAVRVRLYHEEPRIDDIAEPTLSGPLDVVVKVGGAGVAAPTCTSSRASGPRCRTQAALRDRPRERRLGARGRRRRHERGGRHRDPASAAQLWSLPRLPGRQGHAVRERVLPRPVGQRRRHGGVPAHDRPRLREARPVHQPGDVAALADADHHVLRGVRKAPLPLHPDDGRRAGGRLGHIGIQCLAALTGRGSSSSTRTRTH